MVSYQSKGSLWATPEGGDEGVDISPFDNERLRGIY